MDSEVVILAFIAVIVPLATLASNYLTNRTISTQAHTIDKMSRSNAEQASTIDKLIVELDGLPRRVAEQLSNNLLLTEVAVDLRKQLIAAGIPTIDQAPEPELSPLTPMTKEANELVEKYQEEKEDEDANNN